MALFYFKSIDHTLNLKNYGLPKPRWDLPLVTFRRVRIMTGLIVKGIVLTNQVLDGLKTKMESIKSDESGVTAVEYALIVGLIAIVIIGAVTLLGTSVANLFARARCSVVSGTWNATLNTCSI